MGIDTTVNRQTSKLLTRPSPIKGINAFDALGFMPEGYALSLRNMFAQPYGCQVRHGFVQHVVGLPGPVRSLMSHNLGTDPQLYAVVDDAGDASLYNVTIPNAAGVMETALTGNSVWQHVNFPNPAGVFLVACNGESEPLVIDPTSAAERLTAGDGTAPYTISGVDPVTFVQVYSHQKRLWFVEKDTTRAWYLPPDQVYGVATDFNPGPNWTRGGTLQQIITWTIDDGNGADDHLAFISSEGEVSVYNGIDPDDALDWRLQGVYFAGAPVSGHRIATRFGGDILMLTQFGIVYMSDLLKSTKVNPTQENSGRYIQQLVSQAVSLHGDRFGWQPFIFPGQNMVMINVPSTDTTVFQFVQNDITKAWSEFLGYNAYCWELHQQLPFFGSQGGVYRAWEQYTDDAIVSDTGQVTLGSPIRSEAQTTFSFFGEGPVQKQFHMVRPVIVSQGQFSLSFSTNIDYAFNAPLYPATFTSFLPGRWDEDLWDSAKWAGGLMTFMDWLGSEGIGTNASIRMLLQSSSETYWASVDWLYEPGGVM
jgi:hypothetical protein